MELLQRKAEAKFGKMVDGIGRIPSKELLYGFYHFYCEEDPYITNPATMSQDDIMLTFMCGNQKKNILQLANRYYGMDGIRFTENFHIWNKTIHPEEYSKNVVGGDKSRDESLNEPRNELLPEVKEATTVTRRQFVEEKMKEMKAEHPHLTEKQLFTKANMLWKKAKHSI